MLEDLRFYCIYLALLAGIVGVFFYYKLPGNKAKSLLGMIFFSVLTEFVGSNLTKWTGWINYGVYNFYMLVSLSYYLILLKHLLVDRSHRRLADIFLATFILFYFSNFIFIQKNISETFTYSFALGVLFVLIMSCLYLVEIFNSKKILNFGKSVFFWFILGVLLLHVPYLPFMLAIKWFLIESNESVYSLVLFILNVLMYGCFYNRIYMERKEIQLLVISLSIVFFTLLVLILVLFFYFHKKKTNFLIEKMEADLHFQSELVKSRIEMKDQTLTEISRELHDNIGQILSVAIMQVNMYIQNQKAMTKDELNDLKDILGKSLDEIRTLSRIINRDNLLESNFLEAIQLDLERIQKLKRIDCYFSINGDFPEINVEHELIIYRIFQEAILNILKHSHSEIIDFQIDCLDQDNIKIKLIDHGIGFNSKKKNSGSGLNNIHVRAKLIGATVSITSDSSGTVVVFTYPKRINHENE